MTLEPINRESELYLESMRLWNEAEALPWWRFRRRRQLFEESDRLLNESIRVGVQHIADVWGAA